MAEVINAAQLEQEAEQNGVVATVAEEDNNTTTTGKLSYNQIIRKLLTNGAVRKNGLRVKNVNYDERDNYTMVSFTLDKPVPGYVQNDNGTWELGVTNVIFTSMYAIAGALKEDEELGWLANALIENPKAVNLIFNGSTIDIIQQQISEGEGYVNPFSSKENVEPQIFDHDTIINTIVKFKLGKTGQRMADTLAIKMMGF